MSWHPLDLVTWLWAFALTQAIECPIYLFALRRKKSSLAFKLGAAFGPTALTHPIAWWVFAPWLIENHFHIGPWFSGYYPSVTVTAGVAALVEWAYLAQLNVRRPWAWALLANGASFTIVMTIQALYNWP